MPPSAAPYQSEVPWPARPGSSSQAARSNELSVEARESLYHETDDARSVYLLREGAVMLYQILRDGRRQVVDLIRPGEYFGLGDGRIQDCSAETLMPCRIAVWHEAEVARSPDLQRAITGSMRITVARLHDHVTLLGRKTATERVASFLMRFMPECGGRICQGPALTGPALTGQGTARHEIRMSRQEIGDYLGLTLETVSRTFSLLKQQGVIRCPKPDVIVVDDICRLCRMAALQ